MFRTPTIAVLALGLMSSAAFAQNGSYGPPSRLGANNNDQSYDARDDGGPDNGGYDDRDNDGPPPRQQAPGAQAQDDHARDIYCRRDAAARTGYVTPGQAARHEQTNGSIGGTLGGAALGAIIGGASGNAGAGAAIGAGAGLLAGTAVGADNARAAAHDVQQHYAAAYYACMDQADGGPPPPPDRADYAYGPPPPPPSGYYAPGYYGYGPSPYPYYYPGYYGPSVSFGFGFGGHRGWGGGWHHR